MKVYYVIISALLSNILAQGLKPLFHYIRTGESKYGMSVESGGFPSSHTSMVVSLTLALALKEGFTSNAFYVSVVFSLITIYDAANVRYYAGQNIAVTKQLIQDIETLMQTKLNDPVYLKKVKTVLGHQWAEVFGGIVLGLAVPIILYFMFEI